MWGKWTKRAKPKPKISMVSESILLGQKKTERSGEPLKGSGLKGMHSIHLQVWKDKKHMQGKKVYAHVSSGEYMQVLEGFPHLRPHLAMNEIVLRRTSKQPKSS